MIEKYIEFALKNEYDEKNMGREWYNEPDYLHIYYITSRKFIRSIARGLCKNDSSIEQIFSNKFGIKLERGSLDEQDLINEIAKQQGMAIMNNKLPELITNLLKDD